MFPLTEFLYFRSIDQSLDTTLLYIGFWVRFFYQCPEDTNQPGDVIEMAKSLKKESLLTMFIRVRR